MDHGTMWCLLGASFTLLSPLPSAAPATHINNTGSPYAHTFGTGEAQRERGAYQTSARKERRE